MAVNQTPLKGPQQKHEAASPDKASEAESVSRPVADD